MAKLRRLAASKRRERALGFFLDLTARLSGDRRLRNAAVALRPTRPATETKFFTRRESPTSTTVDAPACHPSTSPASLLRTESAAGRARLTSVDSFRPTKWARRYEGAGRSWSAPSLRPWFPSGAPEARLRSGECRASAPACAGVAFPTAAARSRDRAPASTSSSHPASARARARSLGGGSREAWGDPIGCLHRRVDDVNDRRRHATDDGPRRQRDRRGADSERDPTHARRRIPRGATGESRSLSTCRLCCRRPTRSIRSRRSSS